VGFTLFGRRCDVSQCWISARRPSPQKTSRSTPTKKGIYMKINYFNSDHTHALIDLPTNQTIEHVIQLLKGSSSHWINQNRLVRGRFAWGRGYGAFSVSHSDVDRVCKYIANQGVHHRKRT